MPLMHSSRTLGARWNCWKISGRSASGMPMPVSRTDTWTVPSTRRAEIVIVPFFLLYRPVSTLLYFYCMRLLFGFDPTQYHATQLAFVPGKDLSLSFDQFVHAFQLR